jgi:Tol biopolymer transport system component
VSSLLRTAACATLLLGLAPGIGHAAFPGRNGKIAYDDCPTCASDAGAPEVSSACPNGRLERGLAFGSEEPSYSPSGRGLTYAYNAIYVMPADGSRHRRVTSPGSRFTHQSPHYSPDGQSIVFERYSWDTRESTLYVYRRGRSRKLVEGGAPAWSSRGVIAFTRADGIHLVDPRTGTVRFVTRGWSPDWLPGGRRLVFMTSPSNADLAVINVDGTGVRRLARTRLAESVPAASPDGRQVVFEAGYSLYTRPIRGGRARKLRLGEAEPDNPAWQPLSRRSPC